MASFIARRVLVSLVVLLLAGTATFAVFFLLPTADPAALRAGRSADPQLIATIREELGLERSVVAQYGQFLTALVLHLDLGRSYASGTGEPVLGLVLEHLPVTLALTAGAALVWLLLGIALGVAAATRPRSPTDRIVMAVALVALCAPVYWLGLVALGLFADDIGTLWPVFPGEGAYVAPGDDPLGWAAALVLPSLVLAVPFAAAYARLLRATLIDALGTDHVRTARAKGLPERQVVWRHGVRVAITPLVTLLGVDVGALLGGAILVETVFDLPGIGTLAYDAIGDGDLPVIQGTVLFGAVFVIAANLAVDIAYAWLDPRVLL